MMKERAMDITSGLIIGGTRVGGILVNNTVSECISLLTQLTIDTGYGKWVNVLSGLPSRK